MKVSTLSLVVLVSAAVLGAQTPTNNSDQLNAFFAGPGTHGAILNGAPLLPGTTVLNGETVQTGANGVAILAPTHGGGGVVAMGANSSGTVRTGDYNPKLGSDQFQLATGSSLVTGSVAVSTPQGQIFQPANISTSYVVDANQQTSSMGVLQGAVRTLTPTEVQAEVTPAGQAIQLTGGVGGQQVQMSQIKLSDVQKPATTSAVTQVVSESNTGQAGGGQ